MTDEQKKIPIPDEYVKAAVEIDAKMTIDEARSHITHAIEMACKPVLTYVIESIETLGAPVELVEEFKKLLYEKTSYVRCETGKAGIILTLGKFKKDYEFGFGMPNEPELIRSFLGLAGGVLMCGVTFWKFICETRPEMLDALKKLDSQIVWDKLNVDSYKKVMYFSGSEDKFPSKIGLWATWVDQQGRVLTIREDKKKFVKK